MKEVPFTDPSKKGRNQYEGFHVLLSEIFDSAWYLSQNPDVAVAGVNPILHYLEHGAAEGRNPSPLFSTSEYLRAYPDVLQAGINPLIHYLHFGREEGRSPCPSSGANPQAEQLVLIRQSSLFDSQYYITKYSDVSASKIDPLVHYVTVGASAGRNPHPLFDGAWYLAQHDDVRKAGINPLAHYILFGAYEGRDPHPLFDSDWYLAQYPDVWKAGINPLAHYNQVGVGEDRDPHPLFSTRYYRETYLRLGGDGDNPLIDYVLSGAAMGRNPNPAFDAMGYGYEHEDVRQFGGNALLHYLVVGRAAGFAPHPLFERDWYLAKNPEVVQSGIDGYEHYVRQGLREGRLGSRALGDDPNIRGPFPLPDVQSDSDVTIIIPVYGSYFDTYRCLVSISRLTGDCICYQVVLVDDCPSKPITHLLTEHPGLEVVSNKRNLGFLLSCNRAAALTKSKFMIFLNNDTVVRENWLAPMIAVAEPDDRVAMVGCKLLNLDDTIQEAGGIIFRDGWGFPYGRGDDPGLPQYNYVREVDCVIGACMLVRRSVFASLAGFDKRYAPAYYEEFDFAFAVQELNYRVLYQPASEVYHFDRGAHTRDHQTVINHAKFCKKWAARLTNQPAGEREIFLGRERPKRSGTILMIEDSVPQHDKHAGALATFRYLRLLVEHDFKVIFLPHDRRPEQPYTRALQQMGVEVLFGNIDLHEWFDKFGKFINRVWIARPDVAKHYIDLLQLKTNAHITYFTHDLHFLREMRRYEIEKDPHALAESVRLKPIEIRLFNSVDCVTTPSEHEARIIEKLAPDQRVRTLTLLYFEQNKEYNHPNARPLETRHEIIFVGGFAHLPNVDAAIFLLNSVMPLVWHEIPDAEVLILGSNPPAAVTSLQRSRVKVIGYVPDLGSYYDRARMSVNPLRYGAGVKGKILSSLASGVPVVTTTIGNEGISLRPGMEALVGDTPEEIAGHIVRLFKDGKLLNRVAEAGRRLITERFSFEKSRDALFDAIDFQFCNVCGDRSRLNVRINDNDELACKRCGALKEVRALADVLVKRYRRFNCSSIHEAVSFLVNLRIHGVGIATPIQQVLCASKNFSSSPWANDDPAVPDDVLDVCISEMFDLSSEPAKKLAQIHRMLKSGGRYVFTARFSQLSATSEVIGLLKHTRASGSQALAAEIIPQGEAMRADLIHLLQCTGFIVNLHATYRDDADDRPFSVFEVQKDG